MTRQFVWFELNTTDKAAAGTFYTSLFGWKLSLDDGGEGYGHFANGDNGFGGLEMVRGGAPSCWMGYVSSVDTATETARLQGLGAAALTPAMTLPDVGTISVVQDPDGAPFALYQSARPDGDWTPRTSESGDIGWVEVSCDDVARSSGFYEKAFGWTIGAGFGAPDSPYYMLSAGDKPFGGLMKRPPNVPVCAWTFYVNVDAVDPVCTKANELGGRVLFRETLPGMVDFAILQDPQGAVLGVAKSLA
ncbi:MAG: VOC family protein [Myxococcales bacterium]|nr:VOC family protein [Myxococcales bacterium]